jgi:serine phosphatase RsbU (regulator of sigma subunit)
MIRENGQEPKVVALHKPRMTIGRSARADVLLCDPLASRLHAVLRDDGQYVFLADNSSSHGTLVNGVVVREPLRLAPGDVIRIGGAELTFVASAAASLPPPVSLVGEVDDSLLTESTVVKDARAWLAALNLDGSPELPCDSTRATRESQTPHDLQELVSRVGLVLMQKNTISDVLRTTMELVFQALPAERGFVFLREGGDIVCKLATTKAAPLPHDPPPRLSRTILARASDDGTMVLTADARIDPRFKRAGSVEINEIRSVLAVPLRTGSEILGAIYVDNDIRNRFAEADLSVLQTIAAVAAVKIERERLMVEVEEKRRIQQELELAHEIQARLLPMTPPDVPGWDLSGVSLPCLEVGGDYFDFIRLPARTEERIPGHHIGIVVGDASGKGTGAALLISSVHAALRAAAQAGDSAAHVMGKLNRYLSEHAPTNRFVTLFYGELDARSGRLRYSNAGHEPPVIVRADGSVERLREGGIAIGIKEDEIYDEGETVLLRGDALLCFSDGVSDSVNPRGGRFGEARIIEVARAARGRPASRVRDRIEEALSLFVGTAAPVDDMTLVIATRL